MLPILKLAIKLYDHFNIEAIHKQETTTIELNIEVLRAFRPTYNFLLSIWSLNTICRWSIFISVPLSPLCTNKKQASELSSDNTSQFNRNSWDTDNRQEK